MVCPLLTLSCGRIEFKMERITYTTRDRSLNDILSTGRSEAKVFGRAVWETTVRS
jgi:hypothetical protein